MAPAVAGEQAGPGRRPGSGAARRAVLLALAVTAAFLGGAALAVALLDEGAAPAAPEAVALEDRVEPTRRAPLPTLTLDGFDGADPVDLAAYRGLPLVVNFWASWCAPCVEEMPDLDAVADAAAGSVALLGVNTRDAPGNATDLVRDLGVSYDLAADPEGRLFAEVDAFAMPTTLFVDAAGTIVYRHAGVVDVAGMRALLDEHLDVRVPAPR